MRLIDREFRAMNSPLRRFFQRRVEFPNFKRLGLRGEDRDILEIGCGSGYGAVLLSTLRPRSYVGVDLMPEMIELANRHDLPNCQFAVADAADMREIPSESKDAVVIFGILHHIPRWREVIGECHRVLRAGGMLFLEEPSGTAVRIWDAIFKWNHPKDARFSRRELEDQLRSAGFTTQRRFGILVFCSYCLRKG